MSETTNDGWSITPHRDPKARPKILAAATGIGVRKVTYFLNGQLTKLTPKEVAKLTSATKQPNRKNDTDSD